MSEHLKAFSKIQRELKAPKGQENKFGGYKYRSCEDILAAVKPLMPDDAALIVSDEIVSTDGRHYVQATAELRFSDQTFRAVGFAREPLSRKGMDEAQVTGSTSSYARKYALNGLFGIDDTQDPDATNRHGAVENPADFIVPFGNKHKGKRLGDIPRQEVEGFVEWLENSASAKGQPLAGPAKTLVEMVDKLYGNEGK